MAKVLLLAAMVLLSGCAAPAPPNEPVWVGPPEHAGGFEDCPGRTAIELAVPGLRASTTDDARGRGVGLHELDRSTVLWVWADHVDSPRRDKILRLNPVTVHREPDGSHSVCTRVELGTELFTDGQPRTYAVAALFTASAFPDGPTRWVVNWVVGCSACEFDPSGNTTAAFD